MTSSLRRFGITRQRRVHLPVRVATDAAGNVHVADAGNDRTFRIPDDLRVGIGA